MQAAVTEMKPTEPFKMGIIEGRQKDRHTPTCRDKKWMCDCTLVGSLHARAPVVSLPCHACHACEWVSRSGRVVRRSCSLS